MAAVIDLRRDLPKVRKQYAKVIEAQKSDACDYTAPCVIGAMVNPHKRRWLQDVEERGEASNSQIDTLINIGMVKAPSEQHADLRKLQRAFDSGDKTHFERTLVLIERKYLAEQVSA